MTSKAESISFSFSIIFIVLFFNFAQAVKTFWKVDKTWIVTWYSKIQTKLHSYIVFRKASLHWNTKSPKFILPKPNEVHCIQLTTLHNCAIISMAKKQSWLQTEVLIVRLYHHWDLNYDVIVWWLCDSSVQGGQYGPCWPSWHVHS